MSRHLINEYRAELDRLRAVSGKLFNRGEKASLLKALDPYYSGIASTAALIQSHSEKQGFLKALYEDFYRAYNRKAADRLADRAHRRLPPETRRGHAAQADPQVCVRSGARPRR